MNFAAKLAVLAWAAVTATVLAPAAGHAAQYPERAIEWVVPYPAGGGTDIVARTLSEKMSRTLGQPIVIANKPGAATAIGASYVARSRPDGYVIGTGDTATLAANPHLYNNMGYDPAQDFDSVGLMARFALILVAHPAVPASSYEEFVEWAKAQKDGVPYGTPGTGSPHHLATELFKQRTGLPLTHVPYKGAAPAVQDVMGGQVPFMFVDSATGQQYIAAGKLRALAVASDKRLESLPEVPTLMEKGLTDFEAYAWQGLVVPRGTPAETIDTLARALRAALEDADVLARFKGMGLDAIPSTPAEMDAYAEAERKRWGEVIRAGGIKVE